MKIPTLLGLTILIALIASSGVYYFYLRPKASESIQVQVNDLQVVNVFNDAVTVVWQTNEPTIGKVLYGKAEPLENQASDNRDRTQGVGRLVHFVTINSLEPNTSYKFRVMNNETVSPEVGEFKTAGAREDEEIIFSFNKPLKGTVLNTNLNPIDESLVFLNISGAQPLATFSSTAGNFILPLKTVLNKELDELMVIESGTSAEVLIVKGQVRSNLKLRLNEENNTLPPVSIGTNLDLTNYKKEPLSTINFSEALTSINYDFNNDSRINSLDLAILRGAVSARTATDPDNIKKFDLNFDGIINQADIDTFSKRLTGN